MHDKVTKTADMWVTSTWSWPSGEGAAGTVCRFIVAAIKRGCMNDNVTALCTIVEHVDVEGVYLPTQCV
jgi:hypothetical protein